MFLIDSNIKKIITKSAEEVGFVKVGFAKVEILNEESMKMEKWINENYDADMSWLKKGFEKRKDIRLIMDDVKTVISLAYNYYTPFSHNDNVPKISRYAWGKDYHKILKNKLKLICHHIEHELINDMRNSSNIQSSSLIKTKFYVDDGPVMDKVWAKKAGIGWQGKHTNVINPEYGSWIILSEILTNLECDVPDNPIEDLCGSCNICINACPTGAIVSDYQLDSTLCLSYQTIENKGDIPKFINLNGWIFGCDICQDVCPFNHNNNPTKDQSFIPKDRIFNKTSKELENLTEKQFNEIFNDSPVKRTKYKGWKRNLSKYFAENNDT